MKWTNRYLQVQPKDVQELLGHSDISITMNVYAHADREAKRNSASCRCCSFLAFLKILVSVSPKSTVLIFFRFVGPISVLCLAPL